MRGWLAGMVGVLAAVPAVAEDADRGRTLFQRQCAACHQVAQTRNGQGPHLVGLVGRPAASVEGFSYSPALRATGLTWSAENLNAFLANPQDVARGTRQPIRVAGEVDRADLVAYLSTLVRP